MKADRYQLKLSDLDQQMSLFKARNEAAKAICEYLKDRISKDEQDILYQVANAGCLTHQIDESKSEKETTWIAKMHSKITKLKD